MILGMYLLGYALTYLMLIIIGKKRGWYKDWGSTQDSAFNYVMICLVICLVWPISSFLSFSMYYMSEE